MKGKQEEIALPGAKCLLWAGAGGSQKSNLEHHIHLIDFYILTSVTFTCWYNSMDMDYYRDLTFIPLENKLSIGSKLVMSQ